MLHVYTVAGQPLTRYDVGRPIGRRMIVRTNPRAQHRCENCWRLRYAENLVIQVYYDCSKIWCREKCEPIKYKEKRRIWAKQDRDARKLSQQPKERGT